MEVFSLEDLLSNMSRDLKNTWLFLPEDYPGREKEIEEMHSSSRYMQRGTLHFKKMRKNPGHDSYSPYRNIKTPPYSREVAGGGYKYRG